MAASFTGTIITDTPTHKCFDISVPENDLVNDDTVLNIRAGGMCELERPPQVYWATEMTPSSDGPTIAVTVGLSGLTATEFHVIKTSPDGANVVHTFRVYLMARGIFEI